MKTPPLTDGSKYDTVKDVRFEKPSMRLGKETKLRELFVTSLVRGVAVIS